MHELTLVQSMITKISESAAIQGIQHISRINLVNGKFSGANTEALLLAFSLFKDIPLFKNAALEIEEPEIIAMCNSCHKEFIVEAYLFRCAYCSQNNVKIASGQELYINYYEGE
ncbi:MAG: hydrogenase maturation nickel metallochaperone HypA [Pelosinus sp.]|nr:hydrogenase maturation nickel metallochaperone HypA [Pelosinus sp.]